MKQDNGENARLLAVFLIGLSLGISLTILYFDIVRDFF